MISDKILTYVYVWYKYMCYLIMYICNYNKLYTCHDPIKILNWLSLTNYLFSPTSIPDTLLSNAEPAISSAASCIPAYRYFIMLDQLFRPWRQQYYWTVNSLLSPKPYSWTVHGYVFPSAIVLISYIVMLFYVRYLFLPPAVFLIWYIVMLFYILYLFLPSAVFLIPYICPHRTYVRTYVFYVRYLFLPSAVFLIPYIMVLFYVRYLFLPPTVFLIP